MIWKLHNLSASWEFVISFQWPQPREHLGVLFMFQGNTPHAQFQKQCRFGAAKTTPRTISLSWPGQDYLFPVSDQEGSLQGLPPYQGQYSFLDEKMVLIWVYGISWSIGLSWWG